MSDAGAGGVGLGRVDRALAGLVPDDGDRGDGEGGEDPHRAAPLGACLLLSLLLSRLGRRRVIDVVIAVSRRVLHGAGRLPSTTPTTARPRARVGGFGFIVGLALVDWFAWSGRARRARRDPELLSTTSLHTFAFSLLAGFLCHGPPDTNTHKPKMATSRVDRALVAMLYASIAFLVFVVTTFGYGRDQGIYAVVARTVLDGGMPYRDAFDFKPPGIYLIYALARLVFGSWQHGIRVIEALGMVGTVAALMHLADRWWKNRHIGLMAGAMAALVHAQLDFWHTAQPETFGGMLTVVAIVVGTRRARSPLQYVACGVIFGLAGLLKPPLAGGGAVLAVWAAHRALDTEALGWRGALATRWRAAARPLLFVWVGGVLPFVAVVGWFWAKGALDAMYETLFVFTPHYTRLGWEHRSFFSLLAQAFYEWLVGYSSLVSFGILLALVQPRTVWAKSHVGLLLGVVAVQILGVALQGKFFAYHYAGMWPVTALIGALGWWTAWSRAKRHGSAAVVGFALLTALALTLRVATKDLAGSFWQRSRERVRVFVLEPWDRRGREDLASVADVSATGNREVAERLARRVPVDSPVFIWGFEPVIYDLADRPAASHYVYNVPQRVAWGRDEARDRLMRHLEEHPPAAIVVAHHDVFPTVTGNTVDSANVLDHDFAALKRYITRDYGEPERVQDFDIFVRK